MQPIGSRPVRSRLRVGIVAPTLRILGGHAVQAQRMLEGWVDDPDIEARLIPINPVPPAPFDRLLRIKYARTLATQLCYWPLLFRECSRVDVVHVFSASYSGFLLSTLPAVLVARALKKRVLLNYHSGEAPDHLARSSVARWVLSRADILTVVPSEFLRDVFAKFKLDARVVPNTIDLAQFEHRVREPLRPHLLSTRNLEPLYNIGCTLRAFARVQADYPEATLTIVGSGSQEEVLRSLSRELGLRHVTLAGRIPPPDMARYYAAADIYIQTPSIDNMPLSVLEAFASGLPVVSTDVGGVPAILTHGIHGLLAPDNDDAMVAHHVRYFLANPEDARQLASNARESCHRYEWARVRPEWIEAYHLAVRMASRRASVPVEAA